ncbi:hypothetical protein BO71DRAFT_436001 [Aspergillus ellipticus CBS 707.79]|uniref:Transcription factor domain-containing protein n=1 Tax=Aspergillus ellipticus CBS 707.79 TaxID=1448320 RepID=A0A319EAR0_9EURO|nr:hypothetical protein BO71DRAFT_436001 [Aspergillus ellipticus CBS 707.79]
MDEAVVVAEGAQGGQGGEEGALGDVYPLDLETDPPLQPFHALLLVVSRHEAIIALHRPLLAADHPTAEYQAAFQTCINSSRSLLAALHGYLHPESARGNRSIAGNEERAPLIAPSLTWTVWMACLILIYAAWTGHFPTSGALRYARIGMAVLRNIAVREREWPQTCMAAGQDLCAALETHDGAAAGRPPGAGGHSPGPARVRRSTATPVPPRGRGVPPPPSGGVSVADPPVVSGDGSPTLARDRIPRSDQGAAGGGPWEDVAVPWEGSMMGDGDRFHPASMVFGDLAGNGVYPLGAEYPSLPMTDGWSVADGPWLLHGDFFTG